MCYGDGIAPVIVLDCILEVEKTGNGEGTRTIKFAVSKIFLCIVKCIFLHILRERGSSMAYRLPKLSMIALSIFFHVGIVKSMISRTGRRSTMTSSAKLKTVSVQSVALLLLHAGERRPVIVKAADTGVQMNIAAKLQPMVSKMKLTTRALHRRRIGTDI